MTMNEATQFVPTIVEKYDCIAQPLDDVTIFAQFHVRFAGNKNNYTHLAESVVVFIFSELPGIFMTSGSSKHGWICKRGALIFVSEESSVRSIPVFHTDVYVYDSQRENL